MLVRANSPILKTKGFNKDYPEVYGKPEDMKARPILVTTISSGHYAMSLWLKALGLKESDVVIKNMDPAQCVAAFESGTWATPWCSGLPRCTPAWPRAGRGRLDVKTAGGFIPIVLIGDKFCDENPETVAKF